MSILNEIKNATKSLPVTSTKNKKNSIPTQAEPSFTMREMSPANRRWLGNVASVEIEEKKYIEHN